MKKIILILVLLVPCAVAQANKIVYDSATKEIVMMGSIKDPVASLGQSVTDTNIEIPNEDLSHFTYDAAKDSLVRKDPEVVTGLDNMKNFNALLVLEEESQAFAADRIIALSPYAYSINSFIQYRNFSQLKQLMQGLIAANIGTQKDYDILNSILKQQGIDLANY